MKKNKRILNTTILTVFIAVCVFGLCGCAKVGENNSEDKQKALSTATSVDVKGDSIQEKDTVKETVEDKDVVNPVQIIEINDSRDKKALTLVNNNNNIKEQKDTKVKNPKVKKEEHKPDKKKEKIKSEDNLDNNAPIIDGENVYVDANNKNNPSSVYVPAKKIEITGMKESLFVTEEMNLNAKVYPVNSNDNVKWSTDNEDVATVDKNGKVSAHMAGTVNIIAKAGSVTESKTLIVMNRKEVRVYFKNNNTGEIHYADSDDVITLSLLDSGNFFIEGDGVKAILWDSKEIHWLSNKEWTPHFWIDQFNRFHPRTADLRNATVTYTQDNKTLKKDFKINVKPSNIEELKAYVGEKEVSMDNPITVNGSERTYVSVKGRLKGSKEFKTLPDTAYKVADKYNQHNLGSSFALWAKGEHIITIHMLDDVNTKVDFKVNSKYVPVTGITGEVPTEWYIDYWNKAGEKYNGMRWYDDINKGYTLCVYPKNASNGNLKWEALTPDIAEYDPLHSNGVVPKKPGLAKFKVYSEDNPKVTRDVQILFKYKKQLQSVEAVHSELELEEGSLSIIQLKITPSDATEQRFKWTYSKDGIVKIIDSVNIDPTNVNVPKWTVHHIEALKKGTVTVTGTPLDDTLSAKPVVFKVNVKGYENEIPENDYHFYYTLNDEWETVKNNTIVYKKGQRSVFKVFQGEGDKQKSVDVKYILDGKELGSKAIEDNNVLFLKRDFNEPDKMAVVQAKNVGTAVVKIKIGEDIVAYANIKVID